MVGQFGAERKRNWKKREEYGIMKGQWWDSLGWWRYNGETVWDDEGTMVRQFGMMKVQWWDSLGWWRCNGKTVWDDEGTWWDHQDKTTCPCS